MLLMIVLSLALNSVLMIALALVLDFVLMILIVFFLVLKVAIDLIHWAFQILVLFLSV